MNSREASSSKESSPPDDDGRESSCLGASVAASASAAASVVSSVAEAGEDVLKFVSGNPFVEVTKGVIHLYKENQATSLEDGVIRSPMLCILGVPSKIKTLDLLQFTAPSRDDLEMMRIIQDGSPNQYMVLLRFKCQEAADEFFQVFNGARFNSIEEDVCSLVYVSKVETCRESEYYPLAGHTELPLCSICLESELPIMLFVRQEPVVHCSPFLRNGRVHLHGVDDPMQSHVSWILSGSME